MTTTAPRPPASDHRFAPGDKVRKLCPPSEGWKFVGPEMEVVREASMPFGGIKVLTRYKVGDVPCVGRFGPGEIALVEDEPNPREGLEKIEAKLSRLGDWTVVPPKATYRHWTASLKSADWFVRADGRGEAIRRLDEECSKLKIYDDDSPTGQSADVGPHQVAPGGFPGVPHLASAEHLSRPLFSHRLAISKAAELVRIVRAAKTRTIAEGLFAAYDFGASSHGDLILDVAAGIDLPDPYGPPPGPDETIPQSREEVDRAQADLRSCADIRAGGESESSAGANYGDPHKSFDPLSEAGHASLQAFLDIVEAGGSVAFPEVLPGRSRDETRDIARSWCRNFPGKVSDPHALVMSAGVEAAKERLGELGKDWIISDYERVGWIARTARAGRYRPANIWAFRTTKAAAILALDAKLHPPETIHVDKMATEQHEVDSRPEPIPDLMDFVMKAAGGMGTFYTGSVRDHLTLAGRFAPDADDLVLLLAHEPRVKRTDEYEGHLWRLLPAPPISITPSPASAVGPVPEGPGEAFAEGLAGEVVDAAKGEQFPVHLPPGKLRMLYDLIRADVPGRLDKLSARLDECESALCIDDDAPPILPCDVPPSTPESRVRAILATEQLRLDKRDVDLLIGRLRDGLSIAEYLPFRPDLVSTLIAAWRGEATQ